jgi:hypothetical protein
MKIKMLMIVFACVCFACPLSFAYQANSVISIIPSAQQIGNAAQFVSQDVPGKLKVGEKTKVSITMKNIGTTTWTKAARFKLGTQNPQDNRIWAGITRQYLSDADEIHPGQSKTFKFNITAPKTPGIYDFQWRMVHEGVEWFGDYTQNARISVKMPTNNARFISQSVPKTLSPGETETVSITLENSGDTTWTKNQNYKLGTQNPQDNRLWTGTTRQYLADVDRIESGRKKTFSFDILAPVTLGFYNFQWRMVQDGVEWFGDFTPNAVIEVKKGTQPPASNDAQFVSQNVPSALDPGETTMVTVTIKNTGTSTWSRDDGYKLCSRNPDLNTILTEAPCVDLPTKEVLPGQIATFDLEVTAPHTAGIYNFQRQMMHNDNWFGERSPNVAIRVGVINDWQPAFPIRAVFYYPWFPQAWRQGGIYPFTHYNPSLGFYDSGDRDIIRKHLDAMEYGKIEVGIASWWGQGRPTDERLSTILETTSGRLFRWAVYYEDEGFGNPDASQIAADLAYLKQNYGYDQSFFRVDGRFVVFAYGGDETCEMVDRWTEANKAANAYIVLKVFPGYQNCFNQPDGWHQYSPARPADSQGRYSYTISPGFWLAKEKDPRLERNLSEWYEAIRDMTASGADFQLITTFNEWGEGTSVESAEEWESDSGHGDYLDALAKDGIGNPPLRAPNYPAALWLNDHFDDLVNGSLHGQANWYKAASNRASAVVINDPAGDKALEIDPGPGATIVMGKNIPNQNGGRHILGFLVGLIDADSPSVAKIEVRNNGNSGWDKKFQIYFGNTMRVNYAPNGAAVTFVTTTEMWRWYHVQLDLDLDLNLLNIWVDDTLAAEDIPIHPGPITALGLSGWDRPGAVYLDDLMGGRY